MNQALVRESPKEVPFAPDVEEHVISVLDTVSVPYRPRDGRLSG
jgi:hypothetical protein